MSDGPFEENVFVGCESRSGNIEARQDIDFQVDSQIRLLREVALRAERVVSTWARNLFLVVSHDCTYKRACPFVGLSVMLFLGGQRQDGERLMQ